MSLRDCLAAKELGGKKAHECGTWLLKQKEAVPYGEWVKWLERNCAFGERHAQKYMQIAKLEAPRVAFLSLRDCLWQVAQHKVEQQEMEEERLANIAKGKKPSALGICLSRVWMYSALDNPRLLAR